MPSLILSLETSTLNCSVALGDEKTIVASVSEISDQYIHSEKLHVFIEQALRKAGAKPEDLAAVAVDKGPGSYTGLRIGVSAAKGLCYALHIPLIALDSLSLLSLELLSRQEDFDTDDIIIPMIDARRMEVYCAEYDYKGNQISEIEARIIDESSFEHLKGKKLHFLGDGAPKTQHLFPAASCTFHDIRHPSSEILAMAARQKLLKKEVEDVAYFEPFYLKDFIAGKPRKML